MSDRWYRTVAGSVLRRVDLDRPWVVEQVPRDRWDGGDVVVAEVAAAPGPERGVELRDGRMAAVAVGDRVVGALGHRAATLEAVGSWRDVGHDGRMHLMTAAGLLGRVTSQSTLIAPAVEVAYVGHALRGGTVVRMDEALPPRPPVELRAPVVLLVGTSMAAGKTTSGRVVVRALKQRGYRVVAAKLTGAGRYRDVLALGDAGADAILDFVDVGLPSTVVDAATYRDRLDLLLRLIAAQEPDVVVAEAGASPLEPYQGELAMAALDGLVACTVLAAFDPYAVAGVIDGFGRGADLVTGPAASTSAAIELVARLTGLPACNVLDPAAIGVVGRVLDACGLWGPDHPGGTTPLAG